MSNYFKYFPSIAYGSYGLVKNITARVKLDVPLAEHRQKAFLDYRLKQPTRPDVLSNKYYDDPTLDWLVYFANDVVDPYYDVVLTDEQLEQTIVNKYGSLENAQRTIVHWRNNWRVDDSVITQLQYDSLVPAVKQLYDAEIDYNGGVVGYKRKREDLLKETNMIVTYTLMDPLDVEVGDIVEIRNGVNVVGTAHVWNISTESGVNSVSVSHVVGNWEGISLKAPTDTVTIDDARQIAVSISEFEAPYFEPVSAYEYEVERNEAKKKISLISNQYSDLLRRQLKSALS